MKIRAECVLLMLAGLCAACGNSPLPAGGGNAVVGNGAVSITPEQVALNAAGGAAEAARESFAIRYRGSDGTPVLEMAPNQRPAPFTGSEVIDPLGSNNVPENVLYAPIAYEVGGELNSEWPAGFWVGNLITGARAGIVYTALDVTDVEQTDTGLRLHLSTNDPSGRSVIVELLPAEFGSVETRIRVEPATGVTAVAASFVAAQGERFHGFGGRHNALDQRGNEVINFIQAQNLGAGPLQPVAGTTPGTGGENYLFPSGPTAAFYVQAGFVSSAGYAFFLDNNELARWRLDADDNGRWQVAVSAPQLNFLVAPGDARDATRKLSGINGRHRVPPAWALGPVLSRTVQTLGANQDDAASYEAKVRADLLMLKTQNLPVNGYAFEGWDILPRAVTRGIIDELHAMDLRAYLYMRNYVGLDIAGTEQQSNFFTAVTNGYIATAPGGAPYFFGTTFGGLGGVIDYTQTAAVAWWRGRLRELLDLGADGFMQDFGENVLAGMQFANGETGVTMHNRYPNLFHRVTRELLDDYRAETGREIFFYTRAGYSGRDAGEGSAASFENSNFPGDETTDWSRASGIASLTTDMLNRAVAGAWGFNTDVGGYADIHTPPTSKELFIRWTQWAALSPVFRVHNSVSNGQRMPWDFDAETLQLFRQFGQLHREATPLILQLWRDGQTSGLPPTRPLWLHYPDDPRAAQEDQQWLLGPDVLVAPVVTGGATTRSVYFPQGCWRAPDSGVEYSGPAQIEVPAPLSRLPYFFRCGTQPFTPGA